MGDPQMRQSQRNPALLERPGQVSTSDAQWHAEQDGGCAPDFALVPMFFEVCELFLIGLLLRIGMYVSCLAA